MITRQVWHGTLKSFKQFNLKHCNPTAFCGRGYYFTDSIDDAVSYTTKNHGDTRDKLYSYIDKQMNRGSTRHTAERKAERVYSSPRLIECEISMRNPLELWRDNSSVYVQRNQFNRVLKVLAQPRDDSCLEANNNLTMGLLDGVNTSKLFSLMISCGLSIFPKLVRALGYDGCIMHNTCSWWPWWYKFDCNHYIVYNRKQIKKISESTDLTTAETVV